ncbi:epimerase [Paenarthrobacter sp. Z7-10]|uniref:epimerase n=1 Tax=Paenarthrobacter sp. Z7-10 TaxID=2787635 RepID=UPI0022A8EA52|nr:epimerase [Paenarthrobacter sp. Z7-10]MCZ2404969.1 epimerase [Paenarthrobacter sp. Z7-10]
MRILILGGTVFLSAEIARQAVERGHEVTCLARGTSAHPPEGAAFVRADRAPGGAAYDGLDGDWDEVLEVSWRPEQVGAALEALADRAGHWTYVSSCSVYADDARAGADESAALLPALGRDQHVEDNYGEAKVACEILSSAAIGPRLHISRPGLIGGPGDPSDRFGYWPARFGRDNDPVLVPDVPEAQVQVIDVRDLSGWILDAAEKRITGTFNAVGESVRFTSVLGAAIDATGYAGHVYIADPAWLAESGVAHWAGEDSLPLWLPEGMAGFVTRRADKAVRRGLNRRPFDESLQDTLADERERGLHRERRAGLSAGREKELVQA